MKRITGLIFCCALGAGFQAQALDVKAFSLTQNGLVKYDAAAPGAPKTPAQDAVDYLYSIGTRQVNLIPEARIPDWKASVINPLTPVGMERSLERGRYMRLIKYIHDKGMTVGIRPIILLLAPTGNPQGSAHWHGNIQPMDPAAWFTSLRAYLNIYADIATAAKVEEFTVGAELYSMTVGIEDQWPAYPYGFPREWTLLIGDMKQKLGSHVRVMYDINYTDLTSNADGTGASGGEFERWRYRLVDLKPDPSKPNTMTPGNQAAWEQMKALWLSLDTVGIDMYRSLLPKNDPAPDDYNGLVSTLQDHANEFAADIDSKLFEIQQAVHAEKRVIIKEVGYKSCTHCFSDPFAYDNPGLAVNIPHQAAAYQAVMNAFVKPSWPWLMGIAWWDMSTDPARAGIRDPGFTPRGKPQTENVIENGWK